MCGLPASGKTTTAGRLHRAFGGVLIRSCDVFAQLGISLPDWVVRTNGFTRRVEEYVRLRDAAYREMARRLDVALAAGAAPIVVDAVHGEPDKRAAVYAACRARGVPPLLVWCRCDDPAEIERRVLARRGREREPEHEAADLSVVRHVTSLWSDPTADAQGTLAVPIVVYDTLVSRVVDRLGPASAPSEIIAAELGALRAGSAP